MTADFPAVLDACVLVQTPLRDTLLRLAEPPRVYFPRWSDEIIAETVRTLENRIGLSAQKTAYLVGQLREHFGDAWVPGYEPLVEQMTNDPKDRHVLASGEVRGDCDRHLRQAALPTRRARALGN